MCLFTSWRSMTIAGKFSLTRLGAMLMKEFMQMRRDKLTFAMMLGSLTLLLIAANLAMGITFSTVAANQLQAVQMAFFAFLPSIMLSGFMFPFRGMPQWAQYIGELLPLTHFLRVVRGIMLKGNGLFEVVGELWAIAAFAAVFLFVALGRYRRTLD